MFASILIGLAAVVAISLSAALFLFAHLTGRIRRSTTLSVAILALIIGAALAAASAMEDPILGPMALPFGVCLMLAAGINGLVVLQARRTTH